MSTNGPPQPVGVRTADELAERLRRLRAWSGASYRTVHREVMRLRTARGTPEQPVYNTVYRCFQPGRRRLDVELVVDIAQALLGDEAAAAPWRQACRVLGGYGGSDVVEVAAELPMEPGGFVGRAADLQELCAGPGIAVIDGMAGIGKTRLAFQAARRFPAGVRLVVDLRGFDPARPPADPAAVLDGFLRCLGVPGDQIGLLDRAGRSARFRQLLAERPAVVVLDNAASVDQVAPLLHRSPNCVVLVTSRHVLDLPAARHISLRTFDAGEVGEFLHTEGIDIDPGAARAIGELVAYLPLALAIVAARITASPEWTVADHLDRLRHQRSTLRLDDAVEAAISLSYQNLPAELRHTFLLLAAHIGDDFSVYSAGALAGLELPTARHHLDQLVSDQLLQRRSPDRYGFHDLIRRYAIDRAIDELPVRVRRSAGTRLLDNYVFTAARAMDQYAPYERDRRPGIDDPGTPTPEFPDNRSAADWLEIERTNLISAAIFADDHERAATTLALSTILWRYLYQAGYFGDAETLHRRALRTATGSARSRELSRLGAASSLLNRPTEAVEWFTRALQNAREIDDARELRRALNGLGNTYWALGRADEAAQHHLQALDIARRLGDRLSEEISLGNLGAAYERLGRFEDAIAMFYRDAEIAADIGNLDGHSGALVNAAVIELRLGRVDDALSACETALAAARAGNSRSAEERALGQLGVVYCDLGRYDESVEQHRAALAIAGQMGSPGDEALQLSRIGVAYLRQERYAEALETVRRAFDTAGAVGDPALDVAVHIGLGNCLTRTGAVADAIEHFTEALTGAESLGDRYEQARAHEGLAEAYSGADASAHRQEAQRLYDGLGITRR